MDRSVAGAGGGEGAALGAKRLVMAVLAMWVIALIVVAVMVAHRPTKHNVCQDYYQASLHWWRGEDIYDNSIDGFVYLPQGALLYMPFAVVGNLTGYVLWRLVGLALYCHGLWRLAKILSPGNAMAIFGVGALLALGPSMGSLRDGQANLMLAAVMVQTAAELMQSRWWAAAVWLMVGLAVKPIILAMIFPAAIVYRPMRWRLLVAMGLFIAAPWATQAAGYVLTQYRVYGHKVVVIGVPERQFEDLRGMIWSLGWRMPHSVFMVLQVIAAACTAGFWMLAAGRRSAAAAGAMMLAATGCYLMLFNPRTETTSYVIVMPVIALAAAIFLLDQRRMAAGWALAAISVCMWCDGWAYKPTAHWLKPLSCTVFAALLIRELFRPEAAIKQTGSGELAGEPAGAG